MKKLEIKFEEHPPEEERLVMNKRRVMQYLRERGIPKEKISEDEEQNILWITGEAVSQHIVRYLVLCENDVCHTSSGLCGVFFRR